MRRRSTDPSTLGGGSGVSELQCDLGLSKLLLRVRLVGSTAHDSGRTSGTGWSRSGFLHFGIIHIAFNMLLLFQLGQLLERRSAGSASGCSTPPACSPGRSARCHRGTPTAIAGGASGAVFGLMAAAAVGLHRQGVNVFTTGIGTTLLLNIVLTFTIPGISIGGHVGGALAGAVCGFLMMPPRWKPNPKWVTYATPAVSPSVASSPASSSSGSSAAGAL